MTELHRSYYAIIPANVRYDKDLPANAKLLYGEITALCNERGYCWATNNYFAELYKTSDRSVRDWISKLAKRNYINMEFQKNEKGSLRKIFLNFNRVEENFRGVGRNLPGGVEKNFHHNTTVNTTNNNTYCAGTNKSRTVSSETVKEIVDYLNEKAGTKYKATSRKTHSQINARFEEGFNTQDFKTVIDKKVATWLNDAKYVKYLRPETLFGTKFEGYLNEKVKGMAGAKSQPQAYDADLNDFMRAQAMKEVLKERGYEK